MDNRVYWIWLQHGFGAGSPKPYKIYKRFGVERFHHEGPLLWNSLDDVTEKEARMLSVFTLSQAELMLEMHERLDINVITPECEKYPKLLRNIFDPPAVLYFKGEIPDVDQSLSISIVGTRKAQKRSLDAATVFGYQMALSRVVVVSGIAKGVDTAAHKGAIQGMGKSICVLPCGITNGYLIENYKLRERVCERGALVTEYPMDTGITNGTFQIRNRLMSGFAWGTVIIEAAKRSGGLITAKRAREQDRDVFVFPGEGPAFEGSTDLIIDGAKSVLNANDVLMEYEEKLAVMYRTGEIDINSSDAPIISETAVTNISPQEERKTAEVSNNYQEDISLSELSEEQQAIVRVLVSGDATITELIEKTGIDSGTLFGALTELELEGYILSLSGQRYRMEN